VWGHPEFSSVRRDNRSRAGCFFVFTVL